MEYNSIKIGVGLGDIIFGMTQAEVMEILGAPDVTDEIDLPEDETTKTLKYGARGFELSFDSADNYKLSSIDIDDSKYLFGFARSLIGSYLSVLLEEFEAREFSTPTIEAINNEYVPNHLMLFYDDEGMILYFIDYVCESFSIGPIWKNEDEILWPPR